MPHEGVFMGTANKDICKSIMVIEDDKDIRNALVEVLAEEGYNTHSAENGKEALEVLRKIPKPCLVFLDLMMPIMNGREFLDEVMKDSYLAPVPVVVVSAIADKADVSGAVGFLKKPIDIEMILKVANNFCQGTPLPKSIDPGAQSHPQ
jgi:CheY-like chemotaxis protein